MMSRGVELPWTILGRRLRPFSFAIMTSTFVIGIEFHLTDTGPGVGLSEHFAGGFAFMASAMLALGWAIRNDDIHDWGLLLAAGVWGARSTLFFLDQNYDNVGAYLSLCWVVGILGAYALERYDHKWRYHLARGDE
jgi:hypothetical protein